MDFWLQIAAIIGGMATTIFGAVRYTIKSNLKREENMLKYFETKNGHMERMAREFTTATKEFASTIKDLTVEIKLLGNKRRK